jgi:peptidoglycan/xylan/chitin deacetylase (PgdA/CDA1 family)
MGLIGNTPLTMLRAGSQAWRLLHGIASTSARGRCLILMYHDVDDGAAADLFARQMEYLSTVAAIVSLEELLPIARSTTAQNIWCAITFDDGYESVYRNAFPRLQEHGFAAMVYLSTGFIDESFNLAERTGRSGLIEGRPLLSWRQVREMERHDIRFGSHMSEHGDLSLLASREAKEQLHRSREEISGRLGKPCEHFAYPFGRFTAPAVNWVREAGFRTAVTTIHRPLLRNDDLFKLPRAGIEHRYSLHDFKSIIRGDWDFIGQLQTLRRPTLRMRKSPPPPSARGSCTS